MEASDSAALSTSLESQDRAFRGKKLERPGGIEPPPHPWEGRMPPQHLGRLAQILALSEALLSSTADGRADAVSASRWLCREV